MPPNSDSHQQALAASKPVNSTIGYPREEMEEMVSRWIEANRKATESGDWPKHLGPFYSDDAEYTWNIGPNENFAALGRTEIEEIALGVQMEGFETWHYPYDRTLIDDKQGEVVAFWRQVAPERRPDGSTYEIAGTGGSWFRYAGNYKWNWQRDFFDLGNVVSLLSEMAADRTLNPTISQKLKRIARGQSLPGHHPLRQVKHPLLRKAQCTAAMARVILTGK